MHEPTGGARRVRGGHHAHLSGGVRDADGRRTGAQPPAPNRLFDTVADIITGIPYGHCN